MYDCEYFPLSFLYQWTGLDNPLQIQADQFTKRLLLTVIRM